MKVALFILAFVGLFAFPWPFAAALVCIFALFVPAGALAFGMFADALYYAHGTGLPVATLLGAAGFVAAFFIHRFVRSRVNDFSFT